MGGVICWCHLKLFRNMFWIKLRKYADDHKNKDRKHMVWVKIICFN